MTVVLTAAAAALVALAGCGGHGAVGGVLSGGPTSRAAWDRALSQTRASVLQVTNESCEGRAKGSGFVLDAHTLVTNEHVVDGASSLTLSTQQGKTLHVDVARASSEDDLAFVHSEETLPAPLTLSSKDPTPGDLVRALGFPGGGPFTATDGRVIEVSDGARYGHDSRIVHASAEIHPGSSGGPVVDEHGRIVGVVFAVDLHNGEMLAIPVSRLKADARSNASAQLPVVTSNCSSPSPGD